MSVINRSMLKKEYAEPCMVLNLQWQHFWFLTLLSLPVCFQTHLLTSTHYSLERLKSLMGMGLEALTMPGSEDEHELDLPVGPAKP